MSPSATASYQNFFKHARLLRQSMRSITGTFVIVEDDKSLADLIGMVLKQNGRKSMSAGSVFAAKEVISELDGDAACVVVDISLPGESGIELLKWLDEFYPAVPYFIYTGMPQEKINRILQDSDIAAEVVEKTDGMCTLMTALGVA